MEPIVEILAQNPLLLLFTVAAIGYPLGRLRIGGAGLGNAAVLFVGLAFGAIDPRLRLPDVVFLLGLVLFVYTLGLSSAQTFWRSFDREGRRDAGLCILSLSGAALACKLFAPHLGLTGPEMAGAYSGAFTNAPGLAGLVEAMRAQGAVGAAANVPVVAYAVGYPVGIALPMLALVFVRLLGCVDLRREAESLPEHKRSMRALEPRTIRVTNPEFDGCTQDEIVGAHAPEIIFGRVLTHDGRHYLPNGQSVIRIGDLVVAVGPAEALADLARELGEFAERKLEDDRAVFDFRRLFVSRTDVVGKPLRDLRFPEHDQFLITRVRRGDLDFIPTGATVLELGDRVRVVAAPHNMGRVTSIFGDSYRALSEIDLLGPSLGLVLGLLLGLLPIPTPWGASLKLGFAGGPLVGALILGKLGRTGRIAWSLPYSANLSLRNFGLMLFSAGIGTKAGYDFWRSVSLGEGRGVLYAAIVMVIVTALILFSLGRLRLKIPYNFLFGIYAGTQTQPVILAFAQEQTKNDLAVPRYAALFPVATVTKIILAQILFNP